MNSVCKNCSNEMDNYFYCKNCGKMSSFAIIISIVGVVLILFLCVIVMTPKKYEFDEEDVTISNIESIADNDEVDDNKESDNTNNSSTNNTVNKTNNNETISENSVETISQKNAVWAAKNYLRTMAFSYTGLIEQLEFEKYSHEDAVYGVDNCGADWFEQASKSAKNYLSIMPFSREGLIEQLEFEGFTYEQAVYGVEQNGL